MKERRCELGEFALRAGILHAPLGIGKVKVSRALGAARLLRTAALPGHEPVPPRTTGIVRAST
jgi:hypothetical protein